MWFLSKNRIRGAVRSGKWSKVRREHLSKNPTCAVCGTSIKLEVHHVVPVHIDAAKELDPDNLITLCDKYCHFIFGHLMNWNFYNTDIINDATVFSKKISDERNKR